MYEDEEEAMAAIRRLLTESRIAFSRDGIPRIVGFAIGHDTQ